MDAQAHNEPGVGPRIASAAEIRALVSDLVRREREHDLGLFPYQVIGVHAAPEWTGDGLDVDGEGVDVVACSSVLAVREALVEHEGSALRLVLLTDRSEKELGLDVVARLARRRLHRLDPWETVKRLFDARRLDPRLTRRAELAEALVQVAPPQGYGSVPAGILDWDTALEAVAERAFDLPREPDLVQLLRWTASGTGVKRLAFAPPVVVDELRAWLSNRLGPPTATVMHAIAAGNGEDVVPIGIACGVVFAADSDGASDREQAAIRLEPLLGGRSLRFEDGRAWGDAAASAVAGLDRDVTTRLLGRAEELLVDLKVEPYAYLSDILPSGFDQRLDRYAESLREAVAAKRPDGMFDALDRRTAAISDHRRAGFEGARARAARMAVRLARWLSEQTDTAPASFADAATRYADEGSFVDRARVAIREGDSRPSLAAAYAALSKRVDEARERENERFAESLAGWLEASDPGERIVPNETLLQTVVGRVAETAPVVVVVLDALSYAVWRELADDLAAHGWGEIIPDATGARLSGVAVLPSVTGVSRTSLFCGRLKTGTASDERKGFQTVRRLVESSRSDRLPLLFHKNDLVRAEGADISESVASALADPDQHVVGIVINAIDDVLSKGDQLRTDWSIDLIRPLGAVLNAARDGGRWVVIASDHGHIIEWDMSYRRTGTFAERWRPADGEPEPGEILLSGPRVLKAEGRIIAPWSEGIRYAPRKHGYHGGATPQEVVTPIAILWPGGPLPDSWDLLEREVPEWWEPVSPDQDQAAMQDRGEDGRLFTID